MNGWSIVAGNMDHTSMSITQVYHLQVILKKCLWFSSRQADQVKHKAMLDFCHLSATFDSLTSLTLTRYCKYTICTQRHAQILTGDILFLGHTCSPHLYPSDPSGTRALTQPITSSIPVSHWITQQWTHIHDVPSTLTPRGIVSVIVVVSYTFLIV